MRPLSLAALLALALVLCFPPEASAACPLLTLAGSDRLQFLRGHCGVAADAREVAEGGRCNLEPICSGLGFRFMATRVVW